MVCSSSSNHVQIRLTRRQLYLFLALKSMVSCKQTPVKHWRSLSQTGILAEYLNYLRRQAESQAAEDKQEPPIKKQVRLPVVVVQPDDNVEYGRAESRFFPQRSPQPQKDSPQPKLPDTPPKGAYYIEGQNFEAGSILRKASLSRPHSAKYPIGWC